MYKIKIFILLIGISSLSACQIISPIFVDYNGVRRDVAQWINQQQLMSMQQNGPWHNSAEHSRKSGAIRNMIRANDWR